MVNKKLRRHAELIVIVTMEELTVQSIIGLVSWPRTRTFRDTACFLIVGITNRFINCIPLKHISCCSFIQEHLFGSFRRGLWWPTPRSEVAGDLLDK